MLYLHGIGHFHPENVINNAFLESLDIGTNNEWIVERVGILERRTVLPLDYIRKTRNSDPRAAAEASLHTNAQTAAKATKMALERAGITASDIGMVICGGCSPQYLIPAEASIVAAELGIEVPAFDLNAACSSFAAQLHFLSQMPVDSLPPYVLIVNAENNTRTVDYRNRSTAILWGDGTTAAIVSKKVPSQVIVTATSFGSNPAGWNKVVTPAGGHFAQEGPAVQAFAIRRTGLVLKELCGPADQWAPSTRFIGHQANLLMLQAVARRAGVPETLHQYNVDRFGNCGAAGAPGVLSQNWDTFGSGERVAMAVVGSGLSWGGVVIEFGELQ